jgi:hypothetical protein
MLYGMKYKCTERNITISRKVTANTNLSIDKMNSHPINNVLKSYVEIIYLCSQTNSLCESDANNLKQFQN